MSMLYPEYLWLATGSKSNFKHQLIEPLKNYNIVVLPDKSEYNDWCKKAGQLNNKGYKITCNKLLEKLNIAKGSDLVDVLT